MSEIARDEKRSQDRNHVVGVVVSILRAAYAQDVKIIVDLCRPALAAKLVDPETPENSIQDVFRKIGQLRLIPTPIVVVDETTAIVHFSAHGDGRKSYINMYAILTREGELKGNSHAPPSWKLINIAECESAFSKILDIKSQKQKEIEKKDQLLIDWNDPNFILEPADGALGRDAYTVQDVLTEAARFSTENLKVVANAGGTWISAYLQSERPDLLE